MARSASSRRKASTVLFKFYVKCRRTEKPGNTRGKNPQVVSAPLIGVPEQASGEPALPGGSLSSMEILIVEDNLVNQKVQHPAVRMQHERGELRGRGAGAAEGVAVLEGAQGRRGLGPGEECDISVTLMDLEMPIMDGMTCTRRIRELRRDGTPAGHIPIIAMTGYARPRQIESAKAAGVLGSSLGGLASPISPTTLACLHAIHGSGSEETAVEGTRLANAVFIRTTSY